MFLLTFINTKRQRQTSKELSSSPSVSSSLDPGSWKTRGCGCDSQARWTEHVRENGVFYRGIGAGTKAGVSRARHVGGNGVFHRDRGIGAGTKASVSRTRSLSERWDIKRKDRLLNKFIQNHLRII
ncbi:hypothetical protein CY34DRAFT_260335 [Suillus luteus UH-Slu-Lm8-n1]|uniref:Uncharacterized protein n=1 Tax=Suillus luteus UH-Slu-Lm8-n1 TaxID=930992 RepID=A0A0D0B249_9AGAM|nr:hypothetical protein CY34DRAFT_260335 [Suillus luteus UH-Slu-Lm8-n1]